MAVYFANTEITGIKDLFPLSSKDITGLYFADTELFTVWGTYDGNLPATYSANGSMLADYRVYGASGGVGDETAQMIDVSKSTIGRWMSTSGATGYNAERAYTNFIAVVPEQVYYLRSVVNKNTYYQVIEYSQNKTALRTNNTSGATSGTYTASSDTYYVIVNYMITNTPSMIPGSKNTTIPFGYEVDMRTSSEELVDMTSLSNSYINSNGGLVSSTNDKTTPYIEIDVNKTYTVKLSNGTFTQGKYFAFYSGTTASSVVSVINPQGNNTITLTPPSNSKYVRLSFSNSVIANATISMKSFEETTPIYIGDTPLGEDEYVSFKEQKVYRRTENLFDKSNAEIGSIYISGPDIGDDYPSTTAIRSDYIEVTPGETYYVKAHDNFYFQYCAGYNGANFVSAVVANTTPLPSSQQITIPNNVNNIRLIFRKSKVTPYPEVEDTNLINATFTEGSTAPSTYMPYLQPEDPPVALPALPTCDGTTITDYAGQSAAPSRFYAKYRKEGFK